jgi:CubicO group peptidase (beta-lactamase class C family)
MEKIVCLLFLVSSFSAPAQSYSNDIEAQIKTVENNLNERIKIDGKSYTIRERMQHYGVKGVSIAVMKDYQIIWAKAYGWADEKHKVPLTPQTLFKPGSISKSLNAVGVLRLAQDHQLDLYKDINAYLTSWKFPYDSITHGKTITTANLLSHTAGLSVYGGFPGYDAKDKIPTVPEVLDGKAPAVTPAVRSLFEPGLKFQYSGGGTIISQLLITDLTHQTYEAFMYDSVLKPLGMVNSFYSAMPPKGEQLKHIATGYTTEGKEVKATFHVYPEQAPLGLWTNPTELCNYMIEAQRAYEGKPSNVLNHETGKLHLTPYLDVSSAMGTFVTELGGASYFFHDAANEGYRGLFYGSRNGGNGVVIFVNSDEGNIILELLHSVALTYQWPGFEEPPVVYQKKIADSVAQKYPGLYVYEGRIAEVTTKKDGLYYWADGRDCKLYFTSDVEFVNVEFPSVKTFFTDSTGNIKGYKRRVNETEFPPALKIKSFEELKKAAPGQEGAYGWRLLETKRFDDCIRFLSPVSEGTTFIPEAYLAHCYLFKKDYAKAMELYRRYLAKEPDKQFSKDRLKWEFEFFQKHGFDKTLIHKAMSDLKLL